MKKRKICHNTNKLAEVIKACSTLDDDSDKVQLVLDYIKQLNLTTDPNEFPSWIENEDTRKFLGALNIKPESATTTVLLDPLQTDSDHFKVAVDLVDCYYKFVDDEHDLMESVSNCVEQLTTYMKVKICVKHVLSFLSSLGRLSSLSKVNNLGELVVSGAISSLLGVISSIHGHYENGDRQRSIILDDNLPVFNVRSDGTISRSEQSVPYFLREDKSIHENISWEKKETDAFKLILSLKSLLM